MTRVPRPSELAVVSGRLTAIRGLLGGTVLEQGGPWAVLEKVRQIVDATRTRSGVEPGGSASIVPGDVGAVLDALDTAADYLHDRVASCPDCDSSPSDLCGTCEHRLARAAGFLALFAKLGGER